MKKRKTYSKKLNLNEYFEMNMTDVWDGINELQRATKAVALITLVAVLMNSKLRTFFRGGLKKQ